MLRYNGSCGELWSWDPKTRDAGGFRVYPDACVRNALPLWRSFPWRNVTVRLDAALLGADDGGAALAAAIESLDIAEVEERRRHLEAVRHRLGYDWSGQTDDAFSGVVEDICGRLASRRVAGRRS